MPLCIAAIDPSLSSTGYVVGTDDKPDIGLVVPVAEEGPARLIEIRDRVVSVVRGVDIIAIEGYAFGRINRAHALGELGGVLRVAFHELGLFVVEVPPKTLKLYATGNGNADKDTMLVEAVRRLQYMGKSKDEADAYWLYAMAQDAHGCPIVTQPADWRKRSLSVFAV